jgi:hypothetical protein
MAMRLTLLLLLLAAKPVFPQTGWQLEIMPGIAAYRGDLTKSALPVKTIGPSISLNLKYDGGDMIIFRSGFAFGKISADDRDNKSADLKRRNLNFQTLLWEGNICAEVNILDPEAFYSLPYVFIGVGIFRFNPYANDDEGKKTYLQPLSTEGQGLPEYPDKKVYSLTQFCIPFGGGWKVRVSNRWVISYELGVRFLFTDYLDDVSGTYADETVLLNRKGPKAVELAFGVDPPPGDGQVRGNPDTKDMYIFSGVKLTYTLSKKKKG